MLTCARLMMEPSLLASLSRALLASLSALSCLCFSWVWKWAHSAANFLLSSAQCCITDCCSSSNALCWNKTQEGQRVTEVQHLNWSGYRHLCQLRFCRPYLSSFQLLSLHVDLHAEGTPFLLQASLGRLCLGLLCCHPPALLRHSREQKSGILTVSNRGDHLFVYTYLCYTTISPQTLLLQPIYCDVS